MKLDSTISAVVTGGASGLGAATARALAATGVKVAIFDLNEEKGEAVAAEIGGVFCKVNVTRRSVGRRRLRQGARRASARSASSSTAPAPATRSRPPAATRNDGEIKHFPLDAFNTIIQINLVGTFRCIAKSAAGMLTLDPLEDGERGAIVNTASVAAEDGQIGQAAYSASKGGVVGMTLPIARDLMGEGIRVNTILPGIFNTPLLQAAPENVKARARRLGAVPEAPRRSGGVRSARAADDQQRLLQRRGRPPRRRDPHGAALRSARARSSNPSTSSSASPRAASSGTRSARTPSAGASRATCDREAFRKAGEQGYLLMWADEVRRRRHRDFRYEQILIEENGRHGEGGFFMTLHSRLVAPYIGNLGTQEQNAAAAADVRRARTILGIAMTEPDAGSDLAGMRTRAEARGITGC